MDFSKIEFSKIKVDEISIVGDIRIYSGEDIRKMDDEIRDKENDNKENE